MASPEIEKKLSDLSADYIYNEGLGNILLLAISTVDRKATGDFKIPFEVPEEIKNIRKKADDYIINLEDLLGSEDRFTALDDVFGMKKQLVELYKNIYDYYSEWNMLSIDRKSVV